MKEGSSGLLTIQVGVKQRIHLLRQERRRLELQNAASLYGNRLPSAQIAANALLF